jgi:hypothetical protein
VGTIAGVSALARSALLALVLPVAVAGFGGCGGDHGTVGVRPPSSSATGEPSANGGTGGTAGDGGLADCGEILKAYAQLATTAVKGKGAAASAEKTLADLAAKLPSDLQGDLAVVADAFGQIAAKGVVDGASALTSSKFAKANEHILGYLRDDCLPG